MAKQIIRCGWVTDDPLYIDYHDHEWGVPIYDGLELFELLNLEGAQAGLSWITILKKRECYREVFDNFDPNKIVRYNKQKIAKLMANPGIVRHELKINSVVTNARAFLTMQEQGIDFAEYLWRYVEGVPVKNNWSQLKQIPAKTTISDAMSKDLKKCGFKFVGSTICYAFMQAAGMVNDHVTDCFRYKKSL